jgi:hypothetical protein
MESWSGWTPIEAWRPAELRQGEWQDYLQGKLTENIRVHTEKTVIVVSKYLHAFGGPWSYNYILDMNGQCEKDPLGRPG